MTSDDLLKLAGLRPEMREAAREAARRQGVSIDEWLKGLVQSAAGQPAQEAPAPRAKRPRRARSETRTSEAEEAMRAISSRLEQLTEKISDLGHAPSRSAHQGASSNDTSLEDTLRAIEDRVATFGPNSPPTSPAGYAAASRRDTWQSPEPATRETYSAQHQHDAAFASFANDLDRQIAEISARQQYLDDEPESVVYAPAPLQDQFAALSRRLDDGPRVEARAPSRELHDQMFDLTQELQAVRASGGFENSVNTLRRELAEINQKLNDAAPRHAVQALEAEVRGVAARIDEGRTAGGDPRALAAMEAGLAQVYEQIRSLAPAESLAAFRGEIQKLDQKIENLAQREPDTATTSAVLRQLERAIIDLGTIASRAASGDALVALAEEVQTISDRMDRIFAEVQSREGNFSAMIERRFEDLARHLDGRQQSSIATAQTQINSVVNALADKLERVELGGSSSALNAIADQLDHITQRLEKSDSRINQFGHIEQSFTDLVGRMDSLHASAISAAREAALSAAPHQDISSLRQDLSALQNQHVQSERRTQDTLSSVHETLAKLVDRLDVTRPGPTPAATYSHALSSPPRAPAFQAPSFEAPPATEASYAAQETQPSFGRPPIDPTLPADFPLEPGTTGRGSLDMPLGSSSVPREEPEDSKSNFIAAARRAAQAAMHATEPTATGNEKASTFGSLARKLTGRKALILAALLLASLGALHLGFNQSEPEIQPLMGPKKVTTEAIKPVETRAPERVAAATPAPSRSAQPAPVTTGSINTPAAQTPAPAATAPSNAKPGEMPAVSPLTIASIQLPAANELTAQVGRATGLTPGAPSGDLPGFPQGLRSAALTGNAAAEYEVGVRFAEGRGVAQSYEQAARWLERAANRNSAPAQYRLGSLYEKGNGVKKDLDQARRLYRAAADAGNGKAMHNLAVLYAEGIDGQPDFPRAVEWFRKAAMHGIPDSQYNVAILYARGLGTEANLAESYKWFALAAQQGDEDAGKKRDDVGARLEATQLTAAQQAVQSFRPAQQPETAVHVAPPNGTWEASAPEAPAKPKPAFGRKRAQT
ncbi:localization factor PodJL [Variibacter gotjawalensis]|uniref:Localization factor PodJL n=1 Tax=Variibacter gotjawalensis TaxID=1333996 RepID=A0A0S3PVM3_9BRAD|nr:tetratricopeptide repeat protein [Variibacter gotjawalensis]NIK45747.1 localization factor PodJL [Variibacter gotjawalensis]RZS47671.1 localization factor PodJL [Variibacter gotjawalensis]BAT59924.1 localization factor PodJL [Variibacter gotjawalensis]